MKSATACSDVLITPVATVEETLDKSRSHRTQKYKRPDNVSKTPTLEIVMAVFDETSLSARIVLGQQGVLM
jgi:hypothetical protein